MQRGQRALYILRLGHMEQLKEHIVEIVSDSGEGAQTVGQVFGTLCAKMGNGVWTVEIIPAEIEPPARSKAGASGNRIRLASHAVDNMGDEANVVVAFNEQVMYSRMDVGAYQKGTQVYLESKWKNNAQEPIRLAYAEAVQDFESKGFEVIEVPMEEECLKIFSDVKRGKNIWVLGLLCALYNRDIALAHLELEKRFAKKGEDVIKKNIELFESGYIWAKSNLKYSYQINPDPTPGQKIVSNGNQAMALGAMAAGFELCAMYPITPATSATHYLATAFARVGGFIHQAEDEIAAIGFAIGASYAGKTALTITSGPGLALKTEFIGLAVMAEIPLVIVDVQRGGPSTGLPTRVEQSDLLAALYAAPGDAPKIILAPSNIEECFHMMIRAREIAEEIRGPVIVLSDANLATGQQAYSRPEADTSWLAAPIDQSAWPEGKKPYDWDAFTGGSKRAIPGQKGGAYRLTGLAHDRNGKIAYTSAVNQGSMEMRSKKIASFRNTLNIPTVYGAPRGDILVIGWGSTRGAIEEAVKSLQNEGYSVSSLHLRYLCPFEPGIEKIISQFSRVMTIEINYSDPTEFQAMYGFRRYSQLCMLLRSLTLRDIHTWSRVPGTPLSPKMVREGIALTFPLNGVEP